MSPLASTQTGPPPVPAPVFSPTDRHRRGGGPDDRALYHCDCGASFTAPVSTTVGCPYCGCGQDW